MLTIDFQTGGSVWRRFGGEWRCRKIISLYLKYLLNLHAKIIIHFMQFVFRIISAYIYELSLNVKCQCTNSTFVFFADTKANAKNQKSCFLPTHGQTNKEMNEMYIEK